MLNKIYKIQGKQRCIRVVFYFPILLQAIDQSTKNVKYHVKVVDSVLDLQKNVMKKTN